MSAARDDDRTVGEVLADPDDWRATQDFRQRCDECSKQVVFEGGRRLPDCGHDLPTIGIDVTR